ncbi:hypothetical protein KZ844_28825, partial [Pseudomonas aeruginosa]|nr:hypothetical protein [Pseudomonas aeruginosa]
MRHSLWLLLAAILSLPAQAGTECRDIHDRDLRRMCNALERGDSGDCGDIDSRDLRRYCGALLAPGQRYDLSLIHISEPTRHLRISYA